VFLAAVLVVTFIADQKPYATPERAVQFGRNVWADAAHVVVRVSDAGPGAHPLAGLVRAPARTSGAGFGLWLTHRLDTDAALIYEDDGFTCDCGGAGLRSECWPARVILGISRRPLDATTRYFQPTSAAVTLVCRLPGAVYCHQRLELQ
jgi:hypothetical protein